MGLLGRVCVAYSIFNLSGLFMLKKNHVQGQNTPTIFTLSSFSFFTIFNLFTDFFVLNKMKILIFYLNSWMTIYGHPVSLPSHDAIAPYKYLAG